MRGFLEDLTHVLIGGAILVLTISGVASIANRAEYVTAVASIEQLRLDAPRVKSDSEDVIGQVTQWNQRIASFQSWNRIPVIGWLVPDGWDTIKPIEIPGNAFSEERM